MISNKILFFSYLLLVLMIGCGEENIPEITESDEIPVEEKNNFKFKSYKRISPLSNMERFQLEKRLDVESAGRDLLKTFDKNKSKINSNSQE